MQTPDFTVKGHGYNRVAVGWQDATRRYHFWISGDGQPHDDVIHSNPIEKPKGTRIDPHRALSKKAKKWAPLVDAIMAKVRADNLAARACEAAEAKEIADRDARLRKAHQDELARLDGALAHLPANAATTIRSLPEAVRLAFLAALH
jgi:hypothetical protein